MDTRWVLSWCDKKGTWHKEAWVYGDHGCAMTYAEELMDSINLDTQAAIVEQVDTAIINGPTVRKNAYSTHGLWCNPPEGPWNWKQEDWQRGVRVRERARKKHKVNE